MKKSYRYILLILVISLPFLVTLTQSNRYKISNSLDIRVPKHININHTDTTGAFGDGEIISILKFDQDEAEQIESEIQNNTNWNPLPLSDVLEILMYSGTVEDTYYSYNYGELLNMPKTGNGYWFFNDRQLDSSAPPADLDLLNRGSMNFTFAIYNIDSQTLSYLEYDS